MPRPRLRRCVSAVFVATAALVLAVGVGGGSAAALQQSCTEPPADPTGSQPDQRMRLKFVVDPKRTTLNFQQNRDIREFDLFASLGDRRLPAGTPVGVSPEERFLSDDGHEIPPDQVAVVSCVTQGGQNVKIELTIDPKGVPPGLYTARLNVDDQRFDSALTEPVLVTVVLKDARLMPLLLAFIALFAAATWQLVLLPNKGEVRPLDAEPEVRQLTRYGLAFAVAAVAAVIPVLYIYSNQYERDPVWTSDVPHWVDLIVAAFTAASTACAAAVAAMLKFRWSRPKKGAA
jgi:hypothetical protein